MLSESMKDSLKAEVKAGNWENLEWFYRASDQGEEARRYVQALQIRQWLRKAGYSLRRGSMHCIDGRNALVLWSLLGGADDELDGLRWQCRRVDDLRNIYLWVN